MLSSSPLLYGLGFVHVGLAWYGFIHDCSYIVFIYLFLFLPLGDLLCQPFTKRLLAPTQHTPFHDVLLHAWLPCQLLSLWIACVWSRRRLLDMMIVGILFGQGMNVAHELLHRPEFLHKWTSRRLLELSCYGFFEWQHVLGHHKQVGKRSDPATAPKGMTIYRFLPRSIWGTMYQGFYFHPKRFVMSMIRSLSWLLLSSWLFHGFLFHVGVALISICFLEMVNYSEHYGLERQEDEHVGEHHSWDAPQVWSSLILFKLPLHSDHHMKCTKRYPELIVRKDSPKLAYGYPVMIILSLFPPLYFRLMDNHLSVPTL